MIKLEGFLNCDYYYKPNKILPNKITDNSLHIYTLEDHYTSYLEDVDVSEGIIDTISDLFFITVAFDNVNNTNIRDLLLSNNTSYITINKDTETSTNERIILKFNQSQLRCIVNSLYNIIPKNKLDKEDNNKVNFMVDGVIIYNFLKTITRNLKL